MSDHTPITNAEYSQALAGEGEYWDRFVAERLMRGEIPGSIDWRLTFTQFRHDHGWKPFCLGAPGINFRMGEIQYVLKTAVPRPGMRVLDLGCGAGWLSLEMARLGADVVGLDISPANLALARYMAETNARNSPYLYERFAWLEYNPDLFGSVRYEYADLNNAQLPAGEFDAVVVWDSLHHIANLEGLLEQVRRALKPDGVFVGVDHAVATLDTWAFNDAVMSQIDGLLAWSGKGEQEWLYPQVEAMGKGIDWGAMSVDYDETPVEGWEPFKEQLCAEMLEVVRGNMEAEAVGRVQSKSGTDNEESPFEDVSNERLVNTLLDSFSMRRFTTLCPLIEPDKHFPPYKSEPERLFQHYLAASLVKIGERAIAESYTDGQWFLFHGTREKPQTIAEDRIVERARKSVSGDKASRYTKHLLSELERKNAALVALEERVRQYEEELARRGRLRLPWKRS